MKLKCKYNLINYIYNTTHCKYQTNFGGSLTWNLMAKKNEKWNPKSFISLVLYSLPFKPRSFQQRFSNVK